MKRIFSNWWVVTGLIVLILALVLCVGLPLFVGFLRPLWVRLTIAAVLLGGWLLLGFLRRRKAMNASAAIAAELAAPSVADQEQAAVGERMRDALTQLKSASGNKRDYLYSRPWYVIIGPPGAGKTTALLNSGLRFPFAEQSLKGIGGTRNLDFWFADEAALVDTAGRYTTQDSDRSADSQGWRSFLSLLKKFRPKSPINGVIVAIGVDELLKADRAGIDQHAAMVRRRLTELKETLAVSVPVYLLLTKADLLAGFQEFYDDLDVEGRRAVLGATLPDADAVPDQAAIVRAFDAMVRAQSERQAKRIYEEADVTRRSLILGFPAQLAALRTRLARFVDGAFLAGDRPIGRLRGFYLTSGVQQGAPLDRILSGIAEVYAGPSAAGMGQSGRTYFLNRLLSEVVFKEAGLVQTDRAAQLRQRSRFVSGAIGIAAAAALVVVLWGVSFFGNRSFQSELLGSSAQAATLERESGIDLVEVRDSDPDLEQSLSVLRALRNLPQGYAARAAGEPGLFRRFGLFQSSHSEAAVEAYRDGLRRIMLPRLLLRLEQYMSGHAAEPLALYEPLKVYLMLGGQGPLDPKAAQRWIVADWANDQFPGADRDEVRKEMAQHLAALLEDPGMAASWPARKAPLDGQTIASARASLQTLSLGDRAYAVLRQKALANTGNPWRAAAVLGSGDAQAFANGEEVLQLSVPYFFTKEGFQKSYLAGLATVQADLKRDLWVLGGDAETAGIQAQMGGIRPAVAARYAQDYIAAWDKVVAAPHPANYFSDLAAFGTFTKTPSPLKVLLLEVRKNTLFDGRAGAAAQQAVSSTAIGQRAGALLPAAGGGGVDAGVEITNHFRPVHDYVGDGKTPGRLDEFIAALKQAGAAMNSAAAVGGGLGSDAVQGQAAMAQGAVAAASAGAPPQLQGFVGDAAKSSGNAQVGAAKGAISDAYAMAVLPPCRQATQDKYPFFGGSDADASLVDVQQVFGMGGVIPGFVDTRVKPLLDTATPVWRWNIASPVAASLNPSSPDAFAKATQLRDMLVGGVNIQIEAQSFGGAVDEAEFSAGGTTYKFQPSTSGARPVIWSAQGNIPAAAVKLSKGGMQVWQVDTKGPWALFRLMDTAKRENVGEQAFLATFGEGGKSVVFKVSLPGDRNPFSRGGVWSFRCPVDL